MIERYPKLHCSHCRYIENNPAIFRGNARLDKKERIILYLMYNEVFETKKTFSGCGACERGVINDLKKVYEKYCNKLCQNNQENPETLDGPKG